jgi:hypothetical protein
MKLAPSSFFSCHLTWRRSGRSLRRFRRRWGSARRLAAASWTRPARRACQRVADRRADDRPHPVAPIRKSNPPSAARLWCGVTSPSRQFLDPRRGAALDQLRAVGIDERFAGLAVRSQASTSSAVTVQHSTRGPIGRPPRRARRSRIGWSPRPPVRPLWSKAGITGIVKRLLLFIIGKDWRRCPQLPNRPCVFAA